MESEQAIADVYEKFEGCDKLSLAHESLNIEVIVHCTRLLATMITADAVDAKTLDRCLTVLKKNFMQIAQGFSRKVRPGGAVTDELIYALGHLSDHVTVLARSIAEKHHIHHEHVEIILKDLEQRRQLLLGLVQATLEE
ncbi:MAG TPA: hypothetical protein VI913_00335 [Candidatus Peribacteraceae bacterium]|nr:hypothetical protein [Candidatus Peribacteraceae bacterium]